MKEIEFKILLLDMLPDSTYKSFGIVTSVRIYKTVNNPDIFNVMRYGYNETLYLNIGNKVNRTLQETKRGTEVPPNYTTFQ